MKEWQEYSKVLKKLFGLEYSPVAVSCLSDPILPAAGRKLRACMAIIDAGRGELIRINKKNNACFGAAWHLGFHKSRSKRIEEVVKKFVVEGEKLFCSYEALDNFLKQIPEPPDNSAAHFIFSPMEKAPAEPQAVIFICNAEQACRLLAFITFRDGAIPKIKIGGPTCRMIIGYPLLTGEVNVSFYDYTARRICKVKKDKLLVSIPYQKIPQIMEDIDKCSGGRAKVAL